jgi:hypothetical protein
MTDEKDINALRYYVARLEEDLVNADLEAERLRKHNSKQVLDIATLGQEVGRLRKTLSNIVEAWDWWQVDICDRCQSIPSNAVNEARAALAEKEAK